MTISPYSVSNIDKMGCFGGSSEKDNQIAELRQKVDELQSIINDRDREVCEHISKTVYPLSH